MSGKLHTVIWEVLRCSSPVPVLSCSDRKLLEYQLSNSAKYIMINYLSSVEGAKFTSACLKIKQKVALQFKIITRWCWTNLHTLYQSHTALVHCIMTVLNLHFQCL